MENYEQPMLTLGNESTESNGCGATGLSANPSAAHVTCNGTCACIRPGYVAKPRHLSSVDSGLGSTLDPISENKEYCSMADQTNAAEDVGNGHQSRLGNAAMFNAKKAGVSCSCVQTPGRGYLLCEEEAHVVPRGGRLRDAVPNAFIPGRGQNRRAEIQNAASQRHTSQSSEAAVFHVYDEPASNGNDDNAHLKSEFNRFLLEGSGAPGDQNTRTKLCPFPKLVLFCLIVILVVCALAFGLFIHFRGQEMTELKNKITQLERVIGDEETMPSSFAEITNVRNYDDRPSMHLVLKSQKNIPENAWKEKTLRWRPQITENVALHYNDETGALIVKESGTYFVYDQIFVYRHVHSTSEGMDRVANHTIVHTIYKRPFNFPANRKPPIVAESVLSNCWDADAKTQIHSSYQGIIVEIRRNEQMLVALEYYNESMDTLNPTSTFFGIFRL